MAGLSARELLNVWEKGQRCAFTHRAILLLSAAYPEISSDDLARFPIGRRDGLLLNLRGRLFGQELVAMVTCPSCNERLEFDLQVPDISTADEPGSIEDEHELEVDDYQIRFRLPNSLDLTAVADIEASEARQIIIRRCVNRASRNDSEIDAAQLSSDACVALSRRMAEMDPQADIEIDLSCPACEHRRSVDFDITQYLWEEIDSWARRTLEQVHIIASAYGWQQKEILSLSAWRRQTYIELIGNP